ncbi:MAG: hypothetical protein J1G30_00865 [Spirochaetales bacterium]|nr:hypothetical protein [Spirochaetales bacterium]
MTRKFLNVLAVLNIVTMMFLSGCTAAGVECGLIGIWERSDTVITTGGYSMEIITSYEFTNDDKMIFEVNTVYGKSVSEYTIKSVNNRMIKCNDGSVIEYRNLGFDSVEFGDSGIGTWAEFAKVY